MSAGASAAPTGLTARASHRPSLVGARRISAQTQWWASWAATVTSMGSAGTDWPSTLLTTLGGGVIGAVVTLFGSQTGERRRARAEARKAIKRAEKAALHGTHEEFDAALEDLETTAMLAAFPRFLTDLYRKGREAHMHYAHQQEEAERMSKDNKSDEKSMETSEWLARSTSAALVATEAARLFVNATWHPWAGALRRWYRARKLSLMLEDS